MLLLTRGPGGRILTNANVWSPDGEWIVYDTRSDAAGTLFDGTRIEMVHARTGEIRTLYESRNGACCGVATWHPKEFKVAFILGPERPTPDYQYGISRRQGVIVDAFSGVVTNIDARDLTEPGTPGALRGGSHVHIWHPHGDWMSFTYDDDVVKAGRTIAIAKPGHVEVNRDHPRNHNGEFHCMLAAKVVTDPRPGSDDIIKACEEAWIGTNRELAFQGTLFYSPPSPRGTGEGSSTSTLTEVFISDGTQQSRITHTQDRPYPGLLGPRHWLRSSPDGERIACLMKDDAGIVQLWTVTPHGDLKQLTDCKGIESAFTWSPCGTFLAAVVGGAVSTIDARTGSVIPVGPNANAEACVISPNSEQIAFVTRIDGRNQIAVVLASRER